MTKSFWIARQSSMVVCYVSLMLQTPLESPLWVVCTFIYAFDFQTEQLGLLEFSDTTTLPFQTR